MTTCLVGKTPDAARRHLGAPPVEPDCPSIDRVDPEMRLTPGVARERGADGVLGLGLDDEHHAVLVRERPTQDDEARFYEPVHERRVRGPVGLLLQRP